jgi:hypothetical protein
VREELYAQCCDELIRQVTINCAERGLLLLRVRDEMRMTIAAYQVRMLCGTMLLCGWGIDVSHCATAGVINAANTVGGCSPVGVGVVQRLNLLNPIHPYIPHTQSPL